MGKKTIPLLYQINKNRFPAAFKGFFYFLLVSLALTTLLLIFINVSSISDVSNIQDRTTLYLNQFSPGSSSSSISSLIDPTLPVPYDNDDDLFADPTPADRLIGENNGMNNDNNEAYHDGDLFFKDYKAMNESFKIYVYPHSRDDSFANVLLPPDSDVTGNYASELYFKKALMRSRFVTKDPAKADLFYMPFSISQMRKDPRINVQGIPDFVKDYIFNITHKYPFWNRTGGADHFYVACHSIGKIAMDKSFLAKLNVIQLVCSATYFSTAYFPHKDASMPQIWPREGDPPNLLTSKRKKLAFFAGVVNSPVRIALLKVWENDTEIFVHSGRVATPYSEQLLGSKFCIHVKGFEVNTARIGDAFYYGCVPVILANHYDLPFGDILNWKSFAVVVHQIDIPVLKRILKGISVEEYSMLRSNALMVRRHFQWHSPPVDFDAFHLAMYELWRRRSVVRFNLNASMEFQ